MSEKTQSFQSHTRWYPLYHWVATPIVTLNFFVAIRHAWYAPGRAALWNVIFSFGVVAAVLTARSMALAVQDRLIRLEMRLRLREVLPASMHADILRLNVRQMVGLRFASDAELPDLVQRVLKGELAKEKDIKAAIKNWQPDWVRA
jgi:hypothetical protein